VIQRLPVHNMPPAQVKIKSKVLHRLVFRPHLCV
jgi:hypothetical protein